MPLYSPESQAALPLSNTCHDSLAKFFSSKRKPYCTWLHHTRKQTHEAHRKVPVRPEVCKSCKLTPNLPTVREVCTERKEISFLYVLVKKHQVSSANQKKSSLKEQEQEQLQCTNVNSMLGGKVLTREGQHLLTSQRKNRTVKRNTGKRLN